MVSFALGFWRQPNVINGFSDLILELYGREAGDHARSAVGMSELPLGMPVEIETEVEINAGKRRSRRAPGPFHDTMLIKWKAGCPVAYPGGPSNHSYMRARVSP